MWVKTGAPMAAALSSLDRFTLLGVALAFTLGSTALFVTLGFVIERIVKVRIFDVPLRPGQYRREFSSTLRFAVFYGFALALLIEHGFLPLEPFAWSSFFITFSTSYVIFEAYYWCIHRAMHTRALLGIHAHHHLSRVNTPLTSYSMTSTEALLWLFGMLGIPALLALVLPFSIEGLFVFLVVHGTGNIIGHVNREIMPRSFAHSPLSLFAHPVTYHALHHARFHRHYGFGYTLPDRVMKTEWSDWRAVYDRVSDGRPLTMLDEGAPVGERVTHVPAEGETTTA
jgi:lathosterol oxidase